MTPLAPIFALVRALRGVFQLGLSLLPAGAAEPTSDSELEQSPHSAAAEPTDKLPPVPAAAAGGGARTSRRPRAAPAAELTHPRLLATMKGFGESVTSAALSQDGNLAAALSSDRTLRVFSGLMHAGERPLNTPLIANVPLDHGTAISIASSNRSAIVATAGSRHILGYSITPPGLKLSRAGVTLKREFPASGPAHAKPICAALVAPNSQFIVTVGGEDDTTIKLWSPTGDLISTVRNKQLANFGASISADSKLVAVAAASAARGRNVAPRHGQVSVYEVGQKSGKPVGMELVLNVSGHTRNVNAVSFAQDCVHLAVAAADAEWSVVCTNVRYDLKQEAKEHARGKAPGGVPFEHIALSPFATRLVGATRNAISIVDVAAAARGGKESAVVLETVEVGHNGVTALCFSFDGLRVLSGGQDGRLRLWRVEDADKAGTV